MRVRMFFSSQHAGGGASHDGALTKNRRTSAPPAPAAASPWFTRPHRLRPLGAGFAPRAGLSGVGRRPLRLPSSFHLLSPVPAVPPVAPAHPPVHPPVHRPAKTAQRPAGQAHASGCRACWRSLAADRDLPPPPDRRPTSRWPRASRLERADVGRGGGGRGRRRRRPEPAEGVPPGGKSRWSRWSGRYKNHSSLWPLQKRALNERRAAQTGQRGFRCATSISLPTAILPQPRPTAPPPSPYRGG